LATGGLLTVWTVRTATREAFADAAGPFDAVMGARGSPLQLVMAGLLHLEAAPGRVPLSEVGRLGQHPAVAAVIPLAIGDNYRGWRLAGVTEGFFSREIWTGDMAPQLQAGGAWFNAAERHVVAGSHAAARLGLRVGSHLHPEHGLDHHEATAEDNAHEEEFIVTGVLKPTGTPIDRVLWVPIRALQTLEGHDPAAADSASALLVKMRPAAGAAAFHLAQTINHEGGAYTLAWPVAALIAGLFDRLVWVDQVLGFGAIAAMVMAALCVVVALQGSMDARRRDWAILRALGARRSHLSIAVAGEAGAIGAIGIVLGYGVYAALGALIAWQVHLRTGVVLNMNPANPELLAGPALMWLLCLLSGFWPAWHAYGTPVSEKLAARA
jgi:putative ABC transport system permease protein